MKISGFLLLLASGITLALAQLLVEDRRLTMGHPQVVQLGDRSVIPPRSHANAAVFAVIGRATSSVFGPQANEGQGP